MLLNKRPDRDLENVEMGGPLKQGTVPFSLDYA